MEHSYSVSNHQFVLFAFCNAGLSCYPPFLPCPLCLWSFTFHHSWNASMNFKWTSTSRQSGIFTTLSTSPRSRFQIVFYAPWFLSVVWTSIHCFSFCTYFSEITKRATHFWDKKELAFLLCITNSALSTGILGIRMLPRHLWRQLKENDDWK